MFDFGKEVKLKKIHLKFQGGFVGCECRVEGGDSAKNLETLFQFYPDDTNSLQVSLSNRNDYDDNSIVVSSSSSSLSLQ